MTEERRLDDVIVRCEGEGNGVTGRARVYGHRLIKRQDDGQRWMWVKFFARFHALFFIGYSMPGQKGLGVMSRTSDLLIHLHVSI